MKNIFFLLAVFILSSSLAFSEVWIITNSGHAFTPDNLTIEEGDTVIFQLTTDHDARQVSQETWNANGTQPLSGGFQTAMGGDTIFPSQLPVGTHYYVCTPHASEGMKGVITVTTATRVEEFPDIKIALYPNPSSELITVEGTELLGSSSFAIYDQTGRLCLTGILNTDAAAIDIRSLSPGVYILRIGDYEGDNFTFIKK